METRWLKRQKMRYKLEKRWLQDLFGECVSFISDFDEIRVELCVNTSQGNPYTLRTCVTDKFPNVLPVLVVSSPGTPLNDKDGNKLEASFENHCYGTSRGLTSICHCRPERWDAGIMNLCHVLMKGLIWLEAYEISVKTGDTIGTFLKEMPASDETLERIRKRIKRAGREGDFQALCIEMDRLVFASGAQTSEELLSCLLGIQT